jgi:hypothetical protein
MKPFVRARKNLLLLVGSCLLFVSGLVVLRAQEGSAVDSIIISPDTVHADNSVGTTGPGTGSGDSGGTGTGGTGDDGGGTGADA